jgi:hypothetical protein
MKLEELRLSEVTAWDMYYMIFRPVHCPRRFPPGSCRIARSACRRSQRHSTCLNEENSTVDGFEADYGVLDAEDLLEPKGHPLI